MARYFGISLTDIIKIISVAKLLLLSLLFCKSHIYKFYKKTIYTYHKIHYTKLIPRDASRTATKSKIELSATKDNGE